MKSRRGSALIEFALGLVVLAPVLIGLTRLIVTAYVLSEMQSAVRQGAEFASQQPFGFEEPGPEVKDRIRNVVLYGTPDRGERPRIPGLLPDSVRITVVRRGGLPQQVSVSIGDYRAPGGAVQIQQGPRSSFPYRGRIAEWQRSH
jgi:hypothetical protein